MTKWTNSIADRPGPRYAAIVRALADAVRKGEMAPGDRLPPQRQLAEELDLALGTVTRAYEEARDRGLVEATVGRGTFVRPGAHEGGGAVAARLDRELVDLSLLVAPILEEERWPERLRQAADELTDRPNLGGLLGYQAHEGAPRHRRAAADWLERTGLSASSDEVLLTGSAQHAAVVCLSVLTRPGDTVLAEELTTPGLKDAAGWLGLRLHGLPTDEAGLLPDAFEAACRSGVGRVLYTMPTYQNPTTRTMPEERRERLAGIAAEYGVPVVEDGVHALLSEEAPAPLTARLPDHGYFLTSHSKTVAPALRVGYLRAPPTAREQLADAVRATVWMPSPLLAEIATAWIDDGTAERFLEGKRREARARHAIVREALEDFTWSAGDASLHIWLQLPEGWTAEAFVEEARRRGVALTSPPGFLAGQITAPRAVRICVGAARDREALREGMDTVRSLLAEGPA